nr:hypothetical protein [Acidobacteriota bacterium]
MTSTSELPLNVYEVLEEEYFSLHGPLEEDDEAWLPHDAIGAERWRRVRARRDWFFYRGHIKNPISLALTLLSHDPHGAPPEAPHGKAAPSEPSGLPPVERPDRPQAGLWAYLS